jgi:hypothetical protein
MPVHLPEVPLPPIMAWNSFIGIVNRFAATAVPEVVTHQSLPWISAKLRSRILTSLRALKLIGEGGEAQPALRSLVEARGTGQWPNQLNVLAQKAYPYIPLHGLTQTTSQTLRGLFLAHLKRDTKNISKCEAFYLNLVRAAGVPMSDALKKRVATSDTMATVRAARKSEAAAPPKSHVVPKRQPNASSPEKNTTMKPESNKSAISPHARVERIMDLLRMFSGEGLPPKELDAVLTLLDYAKRKAEAA